MSKRRLPIRIQPGNPGKGRKEIRVLYTTVQREADAKREAGRVPAQVSAFRPVFRGLIGWLGPVKGVKRFKRVLFRGVQPFSLEFKVIYHRHFVLETDRKVSKTLFLPLVLGFRR